METQKVRHASQRPARCLECGASPVAVVQRGLPIEYDAGAVDRGEVIYGGCIILDDQPQWQCSKCGCGYRNPSNDDADAPH
jgi:hypothetical protein